MKRFILALIVAFLVCSTRDAGDFPTASTAADIAGSWEATGGLFGYCRLEINDDGKGYLIIVVNEESIVGQIESISFKKAGHFIVQFKPNKDRDREASTMKGLFCGLYWTLNLYEEGTSDIYKATPMYVFIPANKMLKCRKIALDVLKKYKKDNKGMKTDQ